VELKTLDVVVEAFEGLREKERRGRRRESGRGEIQAFFSISLPLSTATEGKKAQISQYIAGEDV
jgi:hypothetical protein